MGFGIFLQIFTQCIKVMAPTKRLYSFSLAVEREMANQNDVCLFTQDVGTIPRANIHREMIATQIVPLIYFIWFLCIAGT